MDEAYETFTMVWMDRTVMVSHQANWLSTGHWHIELRYDDRLPVTETGYRSQFVSDPDFVDQADVSAFITSWLDHEAQSKRWLAYIEDIRQLKLF
jgi:hypothetical protein